MKDRGLSVSLCNFPPYPSLTLPCLVCELTRFYILQPNICICSEGTYSKVANATLLYLTVQERMLNTVCKNKMQFKLLKPVVHSVSVWISLNLVKSKPFAGVLIISYLHWYNGCLIEISSKHCYRVSCFYTNYFFFPPPV